VSHFPRIILQTVRQNNQDDVGVFSEKLEHEIDKAIGDFFNFVFRLGLDVVHWSTHCLIFSRTHVDVPRRTGTPARHMTCQHGGMVLGRRILIEILIEPGEQSLSTNVGLKHNPRRKG